VKSSELAKEFFVGIRLALTCPDVSPREYEGVMQHKIEQLLDECAEIAKQEHPQCTHCVRIAQKISELKG
jgi:hypothetical protein